MSQSQNKEAIRRERNRESRAMEAAPPAPAPGESGEFRADCRKSRSLLEKFRAYRDEVVRERKGGLS